jgi:UDP:flavonoid glycosyltransferase YjiC (YdhE family)
MPRVRVLFTATPGWGHSHPMLPLARVVVAQGNEVRWATGPDAAARLERLVSALAMVVGWEALIVLQDLRGLGDEEQLDVSLWAARALIRAALDEAGAAHPE